MQPQSQRTFRKVEEKHDKHNINIKVKVTVPTKMYFVVCPDLTLVRHFNPENTQIFFIF